MKPIRIVGGELQREPEWSDNEYAAHLRRHRADYRLGSTNLLSMAVRALVREVMLVTDDADPQQLLCCIDIADGLTAFADADNRLTVAAAQARMDVKSARQRVAAAFAVEAEYVEPDEVEEQAWTEHDDRLVLIGQIAELIETMPIEQLDRVLGEVRAVRGIYGPTKSEKDAAASD